MTDSTHYCAGCKGREDIIEKLEADNARLRKALQEVKQLLSYASQDAVNEATAQANQNMAWRKARAALQETSHDA